MTKSSGPNQTMNVKDSRESRLAEALRANLRRRKAAGIEPAAQNRGKEKKPEKPNG